MKQVQGRMVFSCHDIHPGDYEYMLAITPDTLVIIDHNLEPVEFIIRGTNTKAVVFSFEKDDDFLDAINICLNGLIKGLYTTT